MYRLLQVIKSNQFAINEVSIIVNQPVMIWTYSTRRKIIPFLIERVFLPFGVRLESHRDFGTLKGFVVKKSHISCM